MSSNHLKQEQLVWAGRGNDTAENIYKLKEADAIKFAKEHAQEKSFFSDEAKINLHDSDDRKFVKVKEKKEKGENFNQTAGRPTLHRNVWNFSYSNDGKLGKMVKFVNVKWTQEIKVINEKKKKDCQMPTERIFLSQKIKSVIPEL